MGEKYEKVLQEVGREGMD